MRVSNAQELGKEALHEAEATQSGTVIAKLHEADALLGGGASIGQVCQRLEVAEAKRLKELEQENAQLKKLVANLSLDNEILEEETTAATNDFMAGLLVIAGTQQRLPSDRRPGSASFDPNHRSKFLSTLPDALGNGRKRS